MRNPKAHIPNPEGDVARIPKRKGDMARKVAPAWLRVPFGIWVLGLGICLLSGASCARTRAQTVPDGPPLAVPAPPARVIAPPEEPQVAEAPPVVEPPAAVTSPPPSSRPTPRPQSPPAQTPSTTTVPAPAPAPPVTEPPRVNRPTAADLAEEKKIVAILQRASRDINRVNYQRLTADGRSQYEQSKSLAEQAQEAVKDRNWPFAQTLADKAATLAEELLAR
jgi:outer membrane biosynthesis protein TonB